MVPGRWQWEDKMKIASDNLSLVGEGSQAHRSDLQPRTSADQLSSSATVV